MQKKNFLSILYYGPKTECVHYKNYAALLLFKTIKLNSWTSNERTTVLVKKNEKKQTGRRN